MNTTDPARPLDGIRVVELGSSLAGPFASLILGRLGAEVVKVEPPGGDAMRHWGSPHGEDSSGPFEAFNRGKYSLCVDFTDTTAVTRLVSFIEGGVDVVVQNLRPGVAARFGLDAPTLTARCPRLVYCTQWAFGDRGPLAAQPGYDPLMQAFAGIIDATGEAERDPVRVGVSMIDFSTGMWGAVGALALLVRRAATGRGGVVDGSLFESGLAFMGLHHATLVTDDRVPRRSGLTGPLLAPNGGFAARDGLVMIAVGTDAQFERLCEVIGEPGLASDPRFASPAGRYEHRQVLTDRLNARLHEADRASWVERLSAANIPNAPVQDLREAVTHPQTDAIDMIQPSEEGDFAVIGLPLRIDGERPGYGTRAPRLGEHTTLLDTTDEEVDR